MNICIIHGYRLSGTGSNIYVSNIARQLVARGHEVSIMCQEQESESLDFVNEAFFFEADNDELEIRFSRSTAYRGHCSIYKPDLKRRLLVYVYDRYDGFDHVNTFQEAEPSEIKDYIERNVKALEKIIELTDPDILHAHHSIMQPYICYKATTHRNIPYITTVHGSALNFSVRENSSLHDYAFTGLSGSELIASVSKYNADELTGYFRTKGQDLKCGIKIFPVGIDLQKFDTFGFRDDLERKSVMIKLMDKLVHKTIAEPDGAGRDTKLSAEEFTRTEIENPSRRVAGRYFVKEYESYEPLHVDKDIIETIEKIDLLNRDVILFVGKYLWTKGIQTLITALPLIFRKNTEAQVLIVGFGQSRGILQSMVYALAAGNKSFFRFLVDNHTMIDPGSRASTPEICSKFLADLESSGNLEGYFEDASQMRISERVHFTGMMSHEELRYLVPLCGVFVAPSIFTEAFGTVAIEALSCGVLPVITYDFGFREVHDTIYNEIKTDVPVKLAKLIIDENFIANLSGNISCVLDFKKRRDFSFRRKCRDIAEQHYSWENITESYMNVYEGVPRCNRI